ncbi:MAG TPA: GNAT family N-acetyltransferase, partial [Candidatus Limnocylindrales bacterium]
RPVWSIVCFVVSRRARRRGIAARLLDAAVEYARSQGAPALEAYPVDTTEGRPTAATLYTGPLSTFLRAGFIVAREVASPRATVTRTIVRLDLTGDARSATTVDTSLGPRLDSASGAVRAIRPAHEEAHSE